MALLFTTAMFCVSTPLAWAEDGPPAPQNHNASLNAERDRLRGEFENLGARQDKMNEARAHYETLLDEAIDDGDTDRAADIRKILQETLELQTAIHSQSTDVGEVLVELEKPEIEAKAEELHDISQEINDRTAEEIAEQLEWEGDLQDVKEWVTWVTRWVSIGSEMQYETDRGTRLGDYALTVANAKITAVEEMLEDAEEGSYRHSVLTWKLDYYVSQRNAAQEYLDAMETLTQIGYTLDVILLATGAAAVNLGKKIAASAVSRAFGRKAAEKTVVVLEKGLTEIGSDVIGRAAGRETAESGGQAVANNALRESGESAAANSSEMATQALAHQGADQVLDLGLNLTDEGFEAVSNAFQQYLTRNNIPSPGRLGDASPQWVAAWKQFVNQHLDEVVGAADDVIPRAAEMTSEQLAMRILEEEAAMAGRQAFRSPAGQATASYWNNFWRGLAQQTDEVAAYNTARAVAGMRGVKALQQARKAAADGWLDDVLDGSTFFSAAPVLFGLFGFGASEAHAEETSFNGNAAGPGQSQQTSIALQNAIGAKPRFGTNSSGYGGQYGGGFGNIGGAGNSLANQAQYEAERAREEAGRYETFNYQPGVEYNVSDQISVPATGSRQNAMQYGVSDQISIPSAGGGQNPSSGGARSPNSAPARPAGHENCEDPNHGHAVSSGAGAGSSSQSRIMHTPTGLYAPGQSSSGSSN